MLRNEYLVFLIEGMKNTVEGLENNIEDKEGGRSRKKKKIEDQSKTVIL